MPGPGTTTLAFAMKPLAKVLVLAAAMAWVHVPALRAQNTKTYQVTGPVLELTDKVIVVQKGDERWEIARDEKSQVEGDVKVGSKVTVHYRMIAVSVDAKGGKGSKGKTKTSARPALATNSSQKLVASEPSMLLSHQAQRLQAAQSDLDELLTKYTDQHPSVRAKRQQIEEIRRDMASAPVNTKPDSR